MWVSDDNSILADDVLYRRVEKDGDPNSFTEDRKNGTPCLGPAAFTISSKDKGIDGGLSTYIESILAESRILTIDMVDWDKYGLARFYVSTLRECGGGIVADEDKSDPVLGVAHGLLRTKQPDLGSRAAKREWSNIRSDLLDHAVYYDSDPGYLTYEARPRDALRFSFCSMAFISRLRSLINFFFKIL